MYTLRLTPDERDTLGWAVNHGYFPQDAWYALTPAENWPGDADGFPAPDADGFITYQLPEWAAWSISQLREEDPDACFACIGGDLLHRLLELEAAII